jgi:mRNA interferase MazF
MIKRGEIYYIRDIRQTTGSEQRADRPAVIISNNDNNKHSSVYEVVYMTTQPKTDLPTHFITASALRPSTVLCEQISSVYEDRIGEWIGTLTPEEMQQLDQCLAISIDIKTGSGEETENLRQQLTEAEARQQAAEKQMQTYKEMYEFLLSKQLGA